MRSSASARATLASLHRFVQRPRFRAGAAYLVVSPATAVLSALVGSTSEYRFPHPLVATELHLAIAVVALLSAAFAARTIEQRRGRRRTPPSGTDLVSRVLDPLASVLPSGPAAQSLSSTFSPFALLATLSSTLASLCEVRAHRIVDPAFFAFARLLPLLACAVSALALPPTLLPRRLKATGDASIHAALWLVVVAGWGVTARAGRGSWPVALGWAAGTLGWVLSAQAAAYVHSVGGGQSAARKRAGRTRSAAPQQLLQHLVFSIILLAIPTLFSAELSDIRRSRHHAFFLEPGFWAQETAMALLSLVGLGSFWHLVSTCSPLPVFGLVATKDVVILPRLYATLFGNSLDALTQGEALLSEGEQAVLLVLLAGWLFVRAAREEGEELDGGRERWKEG
ncbi:Vitellogenin [Rhodotorula diobovata]|uniref:Vitellogenin n=1 Tax=Rhodotorula diobovata TaxID=5288 RepID=A0A5C5FTX7_9BASI|nr:Vitellogenin [Rhodotorula diobovata]